MRSFSSLAAAYLRVLSKLFDELSEVRVPPAWPPVALVAGLVLCVEASFSRGFWTPVAAAALGGVLAAASGKLRSWLSVTLTAAAFSAVVATPAAIAGGYEPTIIFVARATGGAGAFTGVLAALGWFWLLEGLRWLKLSNPIAWELWLTLRMIPLQARDIARMLTAREARIVTGRGALAREVATSVVGDIILRSYRRASTLSMALAARTLTQRPVTTAASWRGMGWGTGALVVYTLLATLLFLKGA